MDVIMTGVVLAGVIGLWYLNEEDNWERDNPPKIYLKLPAPLVYAAVKKEIQRLRLGEYHFQLVECDPTMLSLRAVCEWRDRSFRAHPLFAPQGYVFGQVLLDVQVCSDRESGMTSLELGWWVIDWPYRAKANLLQAALTRTIFDALGVDPQPAEQEQNQNQEQKQEQKQKQDKN
jgi:hypothetical protein